MSIQLVDLVELQTKQQINWVDLYYHYSLLSKSVYIEREKERESGPQSLWLTDPHQRAAVLDKEKKEETQIQ